MMEEERKYVAPARHVLVMDNFDSVQEEENSSRQSSDKQQLNNAAREALPETSSFATNENLVNNEDVVADDKPVCECSYCHNMILLEDLLQHEQQCE